MDEEDIFPDYTDSDPNLSNPTYHIIDKPKPYRKKESFFIEITAYNLSIWHLIRPDLLENDIEA